MQHLNRRLTLVTAPAGEPLTVPQVKEAARIDHNDDDAVLLPLLIEAARVKIDGPTGWIGRAIVQQTWDLHIDDFPRDRAPIVVPLPPLISIDSVKYTDTDGNEQTLASSVYQVIGVGAMNRAEICLAHGQSWPSIREIAEAVTVRFTAGWAPSGSPLDYTVNVPAQIRLALLQIIAHWYENREGTVVGTTVETVPMTALDNLHEYRVEWL